MGGDTSRGKPDVTSRRGYLPNKPFAMEVTNTKKGNQ